MSTQQSYRTWMQTNKIACFRKRGINILLYSLAYCYIDLIVNPNSQSLSKKSVGRQVQIKGKAALNSYGVDKISSIFVHQPRMVNQGCYIARI
jgi:hypothetical protein